MKKRLKFITVFSVSVGLMLLTTSCGSIMKIILGIPSLKVHSQNEIVATQQSLPTGINVFDATIKGDLEEALIKSYINKSVIQRTYVFNDSKELLCYNGDNSCSMNELSALQESKMDSFYVLCSKDLLSIEEPFFKSWDELNKDLIYTNQKPNNTSKYTVLTFWNSDIEKGNIAENWGYYHDFFKNEKDIQFIRVLTDLNEDWGLKKGAKVSFKNRKVKGEKGAYFMVLKDLPYAK